MSFGTTLALLVGLFVALPVVAHLLRRGRTEEQEFPPAHLVPAAVVTSEQRSRLEDRGLLALRALMVLFLAVLGATPFVRCSHLSMDRQSGASVALAIVIDDSQSMRAASDGRSRFEQAKAGALQLLDSAREGDAIAVVGAGSRARLLLNATTDLRAARQSIEALEVSDRGTDVGSAVTLARSALRELPHLDKRVVLLSDEHGDPLPEGEPAVWAPLKELTTARPNCGIAEAVRQGQEVSVVVGCNDESATVERKLQLWLADEGASQALDEQALEKGSGNQQVVFTHTSKDFDLRVGLTGTDAIERDDDASVSNEATELTVAVVADRSKASAVTGGAPLIEQAMGALAPDIALKPLSQLPDTVDGLRPFAAIVLDDPPGLSPERRAALEAWLQQGGVLLGLLGPASTSAELAASVEPFARPGAQWEKNETAVLDIGSLGLLGPEAASLTDLRQVGRVRLDAADLPNTLIAGKWDDGVPWLFERAVGSGVVLTVGLPTSLGLSELAIRPGFLALLAHTLEGARRRTGPKRTSAGVAWTFPASSSVAVAGLPPQGELVLTPQVAVADPSQQSPDSVTSEGYGGLELQEVIPTLTGRYRVVVDEREEQRSVTLDALELTRLAAAATSDPSVAQASAEPSSVDASPHWAMLVLALFALELAMRAFRKSRSRLKPALAEGK